MTSAAASAGNSARKAAVNAFGVNAFTTSGASGLYNRARPSYPPAAIQKILSTIGNGQQDAHIVEVGAGTGIFTSNLVQSPEASEKIKTITAIEPSSGMRQAFMKNEGLTSYINSGESGKLQHLNTVNLSTSCGKPNVEVQDGSFGEIPVPDGSVDIIVGAQCFHWAEPDYQNAISEFARVLKPNGVLALIWNLEDRNRARWVGQIRDAYESYEAGTPQYRLGWWKKMFETQAYKDNFDPPQQFDFHVIHPTTSQGVIDRVWSKSYITAQPKKEQDKIAERVKEILEKGQDRVWIDEKEGVFEYPYETNLFLMKRR